MVGMGDDVFAERMSLYDRMVLDSELDQLMERQREKRHQELQDSAAQEVLSRTVEIEGEE